MKVTIKDIAKLASVSPTTVSLVLNAKPSRISEGKKIEIHRIANELNYRPNLAARTLVTQSSMTIGVVIPDIENMFFSSLAKKLEETLRMEGYTTILVNTDDHFINDQKLLRILVNQGVDGILFTMSNEASHHETEMIESLEKMNIPFVLMDRSFSNYKCNQVYFDNRLGGYLVAQEVVKRGHKRIGCIVSSHVSANGKYRRNGYERAFSESIEPLEIFYEEGNYRFTSGYEATTSLLKSNVTAIIAANDLMAYGAINKVIEEKLSVPHDILIAGYDNLGISDMFNIQLITVDQNVEKLASEATRILLSSMEKKDYVEIKVLKPELVIKF